MPSVLKRALLVTAAAGSALAMAASPASAAAAGISSSPAGESSARMSGTARSATVDGAGSASLTGSAAASVGFNLRNAQCFANGITFDAQQYETGFSGVQRFRQKAQLQGYQNGWYNATPVAVVNSTRFPNTGASFSFDRHWEASHVANGGSWRVKWQGIYLNGAGAVIAKTKVILVNCL